MPPKTACGQERRSSGILLSQSSAARCSSRPSRPTLKLCTRKDALKYGFFELQRARDEYLVTIDSEGLHCDLLMWWNRVQALALTPVTPHYAEWIWKKIVGESGSMQHALFPEPSAPLDQSTLDAVMYSGISLSMSGSGGTVRKTDSEG